MYKKMKSIEARLVLKFAEQSSSLDWECCQPCCFFICLFVCFSVQRSGRWFQIQSAKTWAWCLMMMESRGRCSVRTALLFVWRTVWRACQKAHMPKPFWAKSQKSIPWSEHSYHHLREVEEAYMSMGQACKGRTIWSCKLQFLMVVCGSVAKYFGHRAHSCWQSSNFVQW